MCVQVRNFKWLNFRVPFSIVNQANQANQLYPHAVSLMESIKTYELMCTKVHVLQVWWLSGSICEYTCMMSLVEEQNSFGDYS